MNAAIVPLIRQQARAAQTARVWAFTGAMAIAAIGARTERLGAQRPAGAQIPGMPDLSGAPADVQAIWKKMLSGGVPTQAEARRLSDWMQSNRESVIKSTKAKAESTARAMGGPAIGTASDQPSCPRKVVVSAALTLDPTPAAAEALLDSLRKAYGAQLSANDARVVQKAIGDAGSATTLNTLGGAFYMKGYAAPAVLAFIAEVSKATGTHVQGAWGDLGAALIGANDQLHAVRALRRALAVGPRTAPYVTNLGVAYADLGDLASATSLLNEAVKLTPSWAPAWEALSSVASCNDDRALALRASEQSQADDWSDSGDNQQTQIARQSGNVQQDRNATSTSASDDAAPLPSPSGPSPFPPAPAGHPHTFDAWQPKLAAGWQEQAANELFDAQMSTAYRQLASQIYAERDKPWVSSPPGSAGGMSIVFVISNGATATHAAERVNELIGARSSKLVKEWGTRDSAILTDAANRAAPIQHKLTVCQNGRPGADCYGPYCQAMVPLIEEEFNALHANSAEVISGFGSLSVIATAKMDAWFEWAGDPDSRHAIDRLRRAQLADMESIAYMLASETQAGPPEVCQHLPSPSAAKAKAEADSARDAGECKSRSIHLAMFATMDADCHSMKMTFDVFDEIGTPTLEIQRASSTKNGKIFIGLGGDALGGAANGEAGLQATSDGGGWITGSGAAASGEAGFDGIAHVSGDLFVNEHGGTSVSGSVNGSVPAFAFAPSVNFGGK